MKITEIREKWAEIKDRFVDVWDSVSDGLTTIRGRRAPWSGMGELVPVPAERGPGERRPTR